MGVQAGKEGGRKDKKRWAFGGPTTSDHSDRYFATEAPPKPSHWNAKHSAFKKPELYMFWMRETMAGATISFWITTRSKKDATNLSTILLESEFHMGARSGTHLLTKRCQYVPVHWDSLNALISPVVDSLLICSKDVVQEVRDDIAAEWLRKLRFAVVYHRRQRNDESSAFICPFNRTSLLSREDMVVPWRRQEGATG